MNQKLILVITIILFTSILNGLGTLRVESIKELPATHTNLEIVDADGKFAPVLVVKTELMGLGIQNVGRPTKYPPEYNEKRHEYKFYMNDNQRVIEFTHSDFDPLEVRLLDEYGIDVDAQRVYELRLSFEEEIVQLPVMISSNLNDVEVYIDGVLIGKTENKIFTANVGSGVRTILAEKDGYSSQEIKKDISLGNNSFHFNMVPSLPAAVEITSEPQGATVYINNIKLGNTPVQSFFEEGTYPIRLVKENYENIEEEITITEPETKKHYLMEDLRATLTIKTHPNATVSFNGESYKGGVSNLKLSPQVLDITVSMPKAESIQSVATLKPYSCEVIEIYPEVKTGTIQVVCIPTGAKIQLKGDGGEYYNSIGRNTFSEIPIGSYELKVKAEGYKSQNSLIKLQKDEAISKQVHLEKGSETKYVDFEIRVNCKKFDIELIERDTKQVLKFSSSNPSATFQIPEGKYTVKIEGEWNYETYIKSNVDIYDYANNYFDAKLKKKYPNWMPYFAIGTGIVIISWITYVGSHMH